MDDLERVARLYALQNAALHGGQPNPKAVQGKLLSERAELRSRAKELVPLVERLCAEVAAMGAEAQRAELAHAAPEMLERKEREEKKTELPELPGAVAGQVVMRFAPNPSGPLTFGHARGVVLHLAYIERYKGKLLLRYDDTDPDIKPPLPEAYAWQREDLAWLGGKPDEVLTASDRVPIYYEHAERGLQQGALYVCRCPPEVFRDLKGHGQACPHRELPAAAQLAAWRGMLDGTTAPGGAAVRVKTDLQSKNPAWREWVALRIVENPHPRIGSTYRVWPVLDFQSAIDDHLTGVTHILRGKDLADSSHKQRYLYEHFGWTYPQVMHWGRVKMHEFGKFSKSLLTEAIAKGEFTGWDDPRLPTLKAMRRRGFQPEAIKAFWLSLGLSERDVSASLQTLEAENRQRIDPRSDRVFFVKDPVRIALRGAGFEAHPPIHPEHPARGARKLTVTADGHVLVPRSEVPEQPQVLRLKDGANVRLSASGGEVLGTAQDAGGHAARIIEWLPDDPAQTVACEVLTPEGTDQGRAEASLLAKHAGDLVQCERYGYCRIEAVDPSARAARLVFTHD
ncbi:MAG: glutamate--tRNA ligase [Halobacteriales archaeon]|nr:glutamate--tRNA ligase [Halobacteriales archaeon]